MCETFIINKLKSVMKEVVIMAVGSFEFVSYDVISQTLRVKFDETVRDYYNVPSYIYSGLMLNNHKKDFFNETIANAFESRTVA